MVKSSMNSLYLGKIINYMRNNILFTSLLLFGIFVSFLSCGESGKKDNNDATAALFKQNCAVCHGNDGRLGVNGAKDLRLSELSLAPRIELIKKGKGKMIGFENTLNEEQIKALAKYTFTFK